MTRMDTYSTVNHMSTASGSIPEWQLSDRLRKIRRDRHLTQDEIAHALGVTPVAWAAWESGRNRPKDVVGLAAAIERRYGVPAAWLLGVLGSLDRRTGTSVPTQRKRRRWTDFGGVGRQATA